MWGAIAGAGLSLIGNQLQNDAIRQQEAERVGYLNRLSQLDADYYQARVTGALDRSLQLGQAADQWNQASNAYWSSRGPEQQAQADAMRQQFVEGIGGALNAAPQIQGGAMSDPAGGVAQLVDLQTAADRGRMNQLQAQVAGGQGFGFGMENANLNRGIGLQMAQGGVREQQRLAGTQYDVGQSMDALQYQNARQNLQAALGSPTQAGAGQAFLGAISQAGGNALIVNDLGS